MSLKHKNLGEYINLLLKWKKRTFLVGNKGYREIKWTYEIVYNTIMSFAYILKTKGIKYNDKVIVMGSPSPEWIVAFFAILRIGGIVVPLDESASDDYLNEICNLVKPTLIIGSKKIIDSHLSLIYMDFSQISNIDSNLSKQLNTVEASPSKPDDYAEIVFTSGTTSHPKGVVLTHRNIITNLTPIEEGIEKRIKLIQILTPFHILCSIPFSHMFGQSIGIFLTMLLGSTLYFTDDLSPSAIIRRIKRDKIITLIAVPRTLTLIKNHVVGILKARGTYKRFMKRWDRWVKLPYPIRVLFFTEIHRIMGLSFWSFIVGGAALDDETHEFWRRLVFAIFQGYGLTETAPIITMFNPFKDNRKSVGKIFPNQKIMIAPDGEILVSGDNIMSGYYNNPDATSEVFEGKWFHTGDIGAIDEKGQLYIKGRKKDIIVTTDGHNIFPEDIQQVLSTIDGVRDSVVFGLSGKTGESVHAVLLLKSGFSAEEIIKKANQKLLPYQRIKNFTVWNEADFPRTPTLKVKRYEVISRVMQKKQKIVDHNHILSEIIPDSLASPGTSLAELGLDSLDMVELSCKVEEKLGVSIDEAIITPETTVNELEKILAEPHIKQELPMPRWTFFKIIGLLRILCLNLMILPIFRSFIHLDVVGLNNLKQTHGPFIIAANHTSHLDPLAILSALPFKFRNRISPAMGLDRFHYYFTKFSHTSVQKNRLREDPQRNISHRLKRALQKIAYVIITFLFQTFPFPQITAFKPSLEFCGEIVDRGKWILIFPEGEVSKSGKMGSFKRGIEDIAKNTGIPVIPVGIFGMHNVLSPGRILPHRSNVTVNIGKPIHYCKENHINFTKKIEKAVLNLLENN